MDNKDTQDNVRPSHFSFSEDSTIRETTNRKQPTDKEPAPGAEIIKMLLRKYGFLTRRLLSKCLISHGHSTIDTVKSLKKMQQQGHIMKYTIEAGKGDDISVFCLSESSRAAQGDKNRYCYDMKSIPYIMEILATAQWSIALKSEKKATELLYEVSANTEGRNLRIPSLSRFIIRPGHTIYIAAMPVCRSRDPERFKEFLEKLDNLNRYLNLNAGRYRSAQTVLICESMGQVEETCRVISRFTELAGNFYLYTTDAITGDDGITPLGILYGASLKNNGEVEITVFSLKGEGVKEILDKTVRKAKKRISVILKTAEEDG